MRPLPLLLVPLLAALLAVPTPARADTSYAIVVGSNPGGAGQTDLRFAEDDARRVADLMIELGGYKRGDIQIVVRPDPTRVLAAIDAIAARAAKDRAAGTPATVFFYYSGHAKANALNLGKEELPLATLRERLLAVPAKLTVVVLDACQSGAFTRVKGAEPAADFSFNSKSRLDATGVAVLASSTASELSQESDRLRSSYFTHHLLVGLRGAADQSRDGRVTIDEAYRYAYHQTLLATAATAVGSQHVSLEVDLKGHGEVPLSYPAKATAILELPAGLEGEILVERKAAKAVLAELHKARGHAVRVAVAPGAYHVLIRRNKRLERCPVDVRAGATGVIDLDGCDEVAQPTAVAKGGVVDDDVAWHDGRRLTLEVAAGLGAEMSDSYTDRLADFGYQKGILHGVGRLSVGARYRIRPHIQLGGAAGIADTSEWTRSTASGGEPLSFSWSTISLVGTVRTDYGLTASERIRAFAEAGAGIGIGRTKLDDESGRTFRETSVGPMLNGSAGLEGDAWFWPGFGMGLRYTFLFAPVIENLAGDRHLGVGHLGEMTVHYRF